LLYIIKNKPDNNDILNYIQQVFLVIEKIHITKTKLTENDLNLLGFNNLQEFILHLDNLKLYNYDNGLCIDEPITIYLKSSRHFQTKKNDDLDDRVGFRNNKTHHYKLPFVSNSRWLNSKIFHYYLENTWFPHAKLDLSYMHLCLIYYIRKLMFLNLINPIKNIIDYGININIFYPYDGQEQFKFIIQDLKYFELFKILFLAMKDNIINKCELANKYFKPYSRKLFS